MSLDATAEVHLVPPPAMGLALTEGHRAVMEISALRLHRRWLEKMPPGDGHGVVVMPGFLGDDGYNAPLRRYLTKLGYDTRGWEQGRNLGPRENVLENLLEHVLALADATGGKVTLIGHSLGGIYARELAKLMPDHVRHVITLGSPFGEGRDTGSYPRRLFQAMNPDEDLTIEQTQLQEPPPMPTTAVFSKGDGVCNWLTCYQRGKFDHTQNIQVWGSHCGLSMNPMVWFLLAERLAQPEDGWQPFKSSSWRQMFYRNSR
jgi:pimeloyl-ACP methyl ester carboxylesterase